MVLFLCLVWCKELMTTVSPRCRNLHLDLSGVKQSKTLMCTDHSTFICCGVAWFQFTVSEHRNAENGAILSNCQLKLSKQNGNERHCDGWELLRWCTRTNTFLLRQESKKRQCSHIRYIKRTEHEPDWCLSILVFHFLSLSFSRFLSLSPLLSLQFCLSAVHHFTWF